MDARRGGEVRELFAGRVHPSAVVTDTELATLAHGGDPEALAVLLERSRPSLYAVAVGLLGNRADAHDAVQDACLVALLRLGDLRDVAAARAWLRTVVRNVCLMRLRQRRELPSETVELAGGVPEPEQVLEEHALRDWVWQALDALPADEREAVMLRHFSRCTSYEAIARVTAVPVGTVRSRLNRARARLADALTATSPGATSSRAGLEGARRREWEGFYGELHERPLPRTYRELFAPDVDVSDRGGRWVGIREWSAHERKAIALGVRAELVAVLASRDVTVVELDFTNPPAWPGHCPPQATFVHRLDEGRSRRVVIHYPAVSSSSC